MPEFEDYEPKFDRLSTTRRVLGHVTDEVDDDRLGPRNTLEALAHGLAADDNTPGVSGSLAEAAVVTQKHLDALADAGLVKQRKDGSYEVTQAGRIELTN